MIALRCTRKLLRELGVRADGLSLDPVDGFLGSWFANLLRVDRRKCVLFTNSITLFSFFEPGLVKNDFRDIDRVFGVGLISSLRAEGLGTEVRQRVLSECRHVVLGPTNNRSVLGSMNDLACQVRAHLSLEDGLRGLDLGRLNRRLNRTPMSAIGYACAADRLREALGTRPAQGRGRPLRYPLAAFQDGNREGQGGPTVDTSARWPTPPMTGSGSGKATGLEWLLRPCDSSMGARISVPPDDDDRKEVTTDGHR